MSCSKRLYENEIAGANAIIHAFGNNPDCCWAIAKALMQSGKSNTYMMTGAELLRLKKVSEIVVISANADRALKEQTKDTTYFWLAYRKYLRSNGILNADEADDFTGDAQKKFRVVWATELKKNKNKLHNALVIWEESHYGQSQAQLVDTWFKFQGISPDGSGCANGNLVLSVSATPFSECIDIVKHTQSKQLIYIEPGSSYFGVEQMMDTNVILPFNEDDLPNMLDELESLRSDGRNAAIIRVSKPALERRIRSLCDEKGIQCVEMNTASYVKDIDSILGSTDEPIVVLLKDMLRMGKRIGRKDRLLWCLETALNANHDTTLQGLVGRCCGYLEGGSGPEIRIYLPQKQVQNIEDWGAEKAGKAMNVKKVGNARRNPEVGGYATVPLKVFIPAKPANTPKKECINRIHTVMRNERGNDKTADYATDILASGDTTKISFHKLVESGTYKGLAYLLERCHTTQKPLVSPKTACGCLLDHIRVWYTSENLHGGYVYVQYKTDIVPENVDSLMAVGNTTGREIFAHKHEDGSETQQNGSANFTLDPQTAEHVEDMKNAIEVIIVWARELRSEQVTPPTEITSDNNGYSFTGILVSPEVYAALCPGGAIYEHIKTNHALLLTLKKSRGRPPVELPAGYSRLAAIKWC
tara:strand:+ start:11689 stop:13617 length:1929 start_codon:yes stop_codon:yes gene_type:complete